MDHGLVIFTTTLMYSVHGGNGYNVPYHQKLQANATSMIALPFIII